MKNQKDCKKYLLAFIFGFIVLMNTSGSLAEEIQSPKVQGVEIGLAKDRLLQIFSAGQIRAFRRMAGVHSLTFDYEPGTDCPILTFYFENETVSRWQCNDWEEYVRQYLFEFSEWVPGTKIYQAIYQALLKLPKKEFLEITKRDRPVIFLDYYTKGIARFASSGEFVRIPEEPLAFENGFYMVKLGAELEEAEDPEAIQGVILHELAHRIFEHLKSDIHVCERELEANQWLKKQGFEREFEKASGLFGAKQKGDSPCQEWLEEKKAREKQKNL